MLCVCERGRAPKQTQTHKRTQTDTNMSLDRYGVTISITQLPVSNEISSTLPKMRSCSPRGGRARDQSRIPLPPRPSTDLPKMVAAATGKLQDYLHLLLRTVLFYNTVSHESEQESVTKTCRGSFLIQMLDGTESGADQIKGLVQHMFSGGGGMTGEITGKR